MALTKTALDIDQDKVAEARDILGTTTLKATVDAALTMVIRQHLMAQEITRAKQGAYSDLQRPRFRDGIWPAG